MKILMLILGTIASMVVFGVATFVVTVLILIQLGLSLHDNYEYYGQYPFLVWGPAVIAFLTPAVIAAHTYRRREE